MNVRLKLNLPLCKVASRIRFLDGMNQGEFGSLFSRELTFDRVKALNTTAAMTPAVNRQIVGSRLRHPHQPPPADTASAGAPHRGADRAVAPQHPLGAHAAEAWCDRDRDLRRSSGGLSGAGRMGM